MPGKHVLLVVHSQAFAYVAQALFLAAGIKVGMSYVGPRDARAWAFLITGTILGALAVTALMEGLGPVALAAVVTIAMAWLFVAHRRLAP